MNFYIGESTDSSYIFLMTPENPKLLEAIGITKTFGSFTANDSINFSIGEGEIHALLGEKSRIIYKSLSALLYHLGSQQS